MIVVSLKRSYFNLLADMRREAEGMPSWRLEGITRGTWPKMSSDLMEGYLDFVVGTYDNMIVTAYGIGSVEPDGDAGITFAAPASSKRFEDAYRKKTTSNASDDPAEWLIGCPMPGGPWKQGESRGTRRYSMETFLEDHPGLAERRSQDFGGNMGLNLLEHLALGKPIIKEDYPQLAVGVSPLGAGTPETGVTVVRQPGGVVVVTIPTGVRAQVQIEP